MSKYVIMIGDKPGKKNTEYVGYFWAKNHTAHDYVPTLDPDRMEIYNSKSDAEDATRSYPQNGVMTLDAAKRMIAARPKYEDQPGVVFGVGRTIDAPALREYTSAERKAMPVVTGVDHYFPDAKAAKARVSKKGNDKHNPGEPLGWVRSKSNDHLDCAGRHLLTPYAVDPDSGELELAHAAWRIDAALQIAEEKRLLALGIKPLSGVTS